MPRTGRCGFSFTAIVTCRHIGMSADHYRTPAGPADFRQKIERSEFLGIVFAVATVDAFLEEQRRIKKPYFEATHHCCAFRLWGGRSRTSDAGEPSGTAGNPI